ncbi:MAG: PAS domain S-box protein, partial [Chloroflexota bacterium]
MTARLCILYLEDNPSDAELVALQLKRDGFDVDLTRVDTRAGFEEALAKPIDLILADYVVPSFNGLDAMRLLKQKEIEIPVILISGTIGEEEAVEAMKAGAFDYLLKSKMARLGVAVTNALHEKRLRDEKRAAESALRASEERYRLLFESNPMPMWVYNTGTLRFLAVNDAAIEHYGYTRDEFLQMTIEDIRPAEELKALHANLAESQTHRQRSGPWKHRRKDGNVIEVEVISYNVDFLGSSARLVLANDITEQLKAEAALRTSEQRFRALVENAADKIVVLDAQLKSIYMSPSVLRASEAIPEEMTAGPFSSIHPEDRPLAQELYKWLIEHPAEPLTFQLRLLRSDGSARWNEGVSTNLLDDPAINGIVVNYRDITERKQVEAKLADALGFTAQVLTSSPIGILTYKFSGECLSANEHAAQIVGSTIEKLRSLNFHDLDSWKRSGLYAMAERAMKTGNLQASDVHLISTFGKESWLRAQFVSFKPAGEDILLLTLSDITERKQAEKALQESEQRYYALFEDSPIAIWEEDFSQVKQRLEALKRQGITDLGQYFTSHPDAISECAALIRILDVNRAALKMYKAGSKEDLLASTAEILSKGEMEHMRGDLIAIAEGRISNRWEGGDETLTGEPLEISLSWSVAPGHEDDFSKIVVTTVDITE